MASFDFALRAPLRTAGLAFAFDAAVAFVADLALGFVAFAFVPAFTGAAFAGAAFVGVIFAGVVFAGVVFAGAAFAGAVFAADFALGFAAFALAFSAALALGFVAFATDFALGFAAFALGVAAFAVVALALALGAALPIAFATGFAWALAVFPDEPLAVPFDPCAPAFAAGFLDAALAATELPLLRFESPIPIPLGPFGRTPQARASSDPKDSRKAAPSHRRASCNAQTPSGEGFIARSTRL